MTGGENLPHRGPYLIAANHVDYLDGFFVSAVVYKVTKQPVYFITKTNNYWWTRVTIPIDPTNRGNSVDDALAYLKTGKIICNFIEGQRNSGRHLVRGRTGTARLGLHANVPIIPIGLVGSSSRNFLAAVANAMSGSAELDIHIGPSVDLGDLAGRGHDSAAVLEATHRIMAALVPLTGKAYIR